MQAGVSQLATAAVPPQNLDAEESILGALMLAGIGSSAPPAQIVEGVRATGLQPGDFYRDSHGRVFRACMALADRREPVDAITVVAELDRIGQLEPAGGQERVHELAALVPAASNAPHYARLVVEKAQQRELIRAGNEIVRLGFDGTLEPEMLLAEARELLTRIAGGALTTAGQPLQVETWEQFEQAAGEHVPCVIERLWPEGGLGFVAAPPKKGKTWIGLSLALSIATGTPFLGRFPVTTARPVVLLALEGHRAAIRTRIGALAHGLGVNPDPASGELRNLRIVYKPRGINLANPAWITQVRDAVQDLDAAMLIVDVLRAAAAIKENSNEEFNALRASLQPINDAGCAIALLHHFGKLTELTKERTPGERMSGTGAMYGAMDVGVFITGADKEARELRLEFELRDLATPDPIGVHLAGEGTGENGGFVYRDTATWKEIDAAPESDDVKAPSQLIYDLIARNGGVMAASEILLALEADGLTISSKTLTNRRPRLISLGVEIDYRGPRREAHYSIPEAADEQLGLIVPISDHLGNDPSMERVEGFHPSPVSTLEPHNHAETHLAMETGGNHDVSTLETACLSQNSWVETHPSPTERDATPEASPLTEGATDHDERPPLDETLAPEPDPPNTPSDWLNS